MIRGKSCHVVLTTRGGSQRLQGKNLMECNGKPLAWWATSQCFKSFFVDRIFHISDDAEHRSVFAGWGCEIIPEPDNLTLDHVPILDVLKYAVTRIDAKDDDYIIWVDVSKPMTRAAHIEKCIRCADAYGHDSVFTTKKLRYNIIGDSAVVSQLKPQSEVKYLCFGAVRLRTKRVIETAQSGTWGYGLNHCDLPICEDHEIDVDNLHDLIMAEALLKSGY